MAARSLCVRAKVPQCSRQTSPQFALFSPKRRWGVGVGVGRAVRARKRISNRLQPNADSTLDLTILRSDLQ